MKRTLLLFATALILSIQSYAQNVGINDDGTPPDNSAMLDVKSTSKGLLIPQIALIGVYDITTIPDPAVSLLVYNTTTGTDLTAGYYYWSGSVWIALTTTIADGSETKVTAGSNVTVTGTGTSGDPYVINTLVHSIGESYGGGIIFWLDASKQHGLIATTADQSSGIQWYNGGYTTTNATLDGVYAGSENTALIFSNHGAGTYAAKACDNHTASVNNEYYNDWYLPSKYELNLLYLQKGKVGGCSNNYYWSSNEDGNDAAWYQDFDNGNQDYIGKDYYSHLRCIRGF